MMATFFFLNCCIVIFYIFYNVSVPLCLFIFNFKTLNNCLLLKTNNFLTKMERCLPLPQDLGDVAHPGGISAPPLERGVGALCGVGGSHWPGG